MDSYGEEVDCRYSQSAFELVFNLPRAYVDFVLIRNGSRMRMHVES
jgi:hypothetical protein